MLRKLALLLRTLFLKSPSRGRTVTAVISVGFLSSILSQIDQWPFTCAPMFSRIGTGPTSSFLAVVGVPGDTGSTGPFRLQEHHLSPITQFDVKMMVARALQHDRGKPGAPNLRRVLTGLGILYERRRCAGAHQDPPLLRLDLVEDSYRLDDVPLHGHGSLVERTLYSLEVPW